MQHTHYSSTFTSKTFPVTLICENVSNAPNIGSLFRICDAFGVQNIVFCGEQLPIPSRKMQKTARATEKHMPYKCITEIQDYLSKITATHQIIALEITSDSSPIQNYSVSFNKPIALIIGDENFGVSESTLNQATDVIHINMFGKNSSMNVVQAANIALYEITKQFQEIKNS